MRKKYNKPKLAVEKMNLTLLVDVSYIHVGGSGSFQAKESSWYLDEEDDDSYEW